VRNRANRTAPRADISNQPGGSDLYIADSFNNRIRHVDLTTGVIDTLAGAGRNNDSGDGGPAILAQLSDPRGVAVTPTGDVVVSDTGNNSLRLVHIARLSPPPSPSVVPSPPDVPGPPAGDPAIGNPGAGVPSSGDPVPDPTGPGGVVTGAPAGTGLGYRLVASDGGSSPSATPDTSARRPTRHRFRWSASRGSVAGGAAGQGSVSPGGRRWGRAGHPGGGIRRCP
jgi:hypothetical protein